MGNVPRRYERAEQAADEERGEAPPYDPEEDEEDEEDEGSSSPAEEDEDSLEGLSPSAPRGGLWRGPDPSSSTFSTLDSLTSTVMGHEWHTQRLVSRPPKVHHTRTVKCGVNLSRETLRLLPVIDVGAAATTTTATDEGGRGEAEAPEDDSTPREAAEQSAPAPTRYRVEFGFDANVECRVQVFLVAWEKRDDDNRLLGYG